MKPTFHVIIHACSLLAGISAMGDTIAHWRFEGDGVTTPTPGTQIEDSNSRTTITTGVGIRAVDSSGNGNTIWTWDHAWAGHTYDSGVPWSVVPQSGAPNSFFAKNSGDYPALFTWSNKSVPGGTNIDTWTSLTWTIEASCYTSILGGFRTVVGREGNGVETANASAAPLYFQKQSNDRFRIAYVDASGVMRVVEDPSAMVANQWYHYAATCDGITLKLLKKTTGDPAYAVVGSLSVSASTNAALINPGNDITGQPWGWTIGRGRYGTNDDPGQNHGDRWWGGIDEVRISNVALDPSLLLASPNASDGDNDGLPNAWETAYGLNPNSSTGNDGASGDPDGDLSSNMDEYLAGSLPNSNSSIPGDVDGDSLADAWENSNFNSLQQTGSGDPDGDLATNNEEESSLSNPLDPLQWPDSDFDNMNDAWETTFFGTGNLAKDGTADSDGDSYTDLEEHDAHTNPTATTGSRVSPVWSSLKNRWSFNGNLSDSVGGSDATIVEVGANDVFQSPTAVLMTGGTKATSDYVRLGSNLLPDSTTPVTIELWTKQNTIRNWSRVFDFHADTTEELFMSWSTALNDASERVEWRDNGVVAGVWDSNQPFGTLNEQHIVMTIEPLAGAGGTTRVTWYSAPSGQATLGAAQGTFDTAITLVNFNDAVNTLGLSPWPDDTASATYNEVRIWNGPLNSWTREKLHVQGPDNATITDADVDFMPDDWETAYFTNTTSASSALADSDNDTTSNRDEFIAGSNPNNSLSTPFDLDGDGLDDYWEIQYFNNITAQNGEGDPDSDNFTNEQEETNNTNPTTNDNDFDGLNDIWETTWFTNWPTAAQADPLRYLGYDDPDSDNYDNEAEETAGTNPTSAVFTPVDTDGDGLLDAWEITHFTSITAQDNSGNPDGDAFNNEQEETGKSNPNEILSIPGDINGDGIADGRVLLVGDVIGSTSFNSNLNWDDANAPVAGTNYLVAVNGLRTPIDAAAYTFAGDKLVIATGGQLIVKGDGVITIPYLGMDGGSVANALNSNLTLTLEGAVHVSRASTLACNNNNIIVNATIAGTKNLTITGIAARVVTFNAANTWTGSLNLTTAGMALGSAGSMTFKPAATGVNNTISGSGAATLNGAFNIDLSAAGSTAGDNWDLITTTGALTYGSTFTVNGFTSDGAAAGARKWTSGAYQFDETSGMLSVAAVGNDSDSDGMDDTWENTYFGGSSQSATGDFDGDGTDNLTEYRLGLIPNSGSSVFSVTRGAAGLLTWPSATGLTFTVQRSANLGSWTSIASVPGTAGTATFTDPAAPANQAFYRIVLEP